VSIFGSALVGLVLAGICPAMAVASACAARDSKSAFRTSAAGVDLEMKARALSGTPASWHSSVISVT